ncbi:MAG TPA: hypothetical protein P5246_02060 [Candidatus Omnitrophota bacterium]|nr:hypothetical protein [Candidatus Omnitrophota bacterium]HSA31447.1 hypothetical protein [Candidatus Omnitrophota bacterium]
MGIFQKFQKMVWRLKNRKIRKTRHIFKDYGYIVKKLTLPKDGVFKYARWLHPACGNLHFSQQAMDSLRSMIKPGDTVIDIGAQTGDTTLP